MKHIGILLFDDVELLDFAGPYEVFTAVNEVRNEKLCNVFTVSETGNDIVTINGLKVLSDFSITNCPPVDILVIPGGNGTRKLVNHSSLIRWLQKMANHCEIIFSVCSGARLLAKSGLLDGVEFTTHHLVYEDVAQLAPTAKLMIEKRFTDNGKVMTAGGITAGIDLSLYILEKLFEKTTADKVRVYMEYGEWR